MYEVTILEDGSKLREVEKSFLGIQINLKFANQGFYFDLKVKNKRIIFLLWMKKVNAMQKSIFQIKVFYKTIFSKIY
tara:strand:+ start:472 stop:702 length:231 start_codon:yes stop_codon:yes gene_type:complete